MLCLHGYYLLLATIFLGAPSPLLAQSESDNEAAEEAVSNMLDAVDGKKKLPKPKAIDASSAVDVSPEDVDGAAVNKKRKKGAASVAVPKEGKKQKEKTPDPRRVSGKTKARSGAAAEDPYSGQGLPSAGYNLKPAAEAAAQGKTKSAEKSKRKSKGKRRAKVEASPAPEAPVESKSGAEQAEDF